MNNLGLNRKITFGLIFVLSIFLWKSFANKHEKANSGFQKNFAGLDSSGNHELIHLNIPLIFIEAGNFTMGSLEGDSDELPLHPVAIDGFYLGKYEITNEQFCEFLNEKGKRLFEEIT